MVNALLKGDNKDNNNNCCKYMYVYTICDLNIFHQIFCTCDIYNVTSFLSYPLYMNIRWSTCLYVHADPNLHTVCSVPHVMTVLIMLNVVSSGH